LTATAVDKTQQFASKKWMLLFGRSSLWQLLFSQLDTWFNGL
jgi:hypothetical protein